MGLSGPKQKQRLVGSASTRNTAWLNDASAPGQRMLAQMGWSTGQSLGLAMPGLTENLKVAYKMDNKGIGAQRHEREARANGKNIWVGGGGDLGSLFERLNAANAASSSSSPVASSSASAAGSDDEKKKKSKKSKKEKKDKKDKKSKKDKSSDEKSSKKRKHDDSDDASDDKSKKGKKGKEDKKDKSESRKSKRALEKQKADAVAAVASADPTLAKDPAAVDEIKKDVVQRRPVRLAHRAKFLRAKRMVSANDLASVNEILGIASTPSSSAAGTPKATSGTSTPTLAPKTYPGPGGSEIPLMDVDRRLEAEKDSKASPDSDDDKKSKKKEKKEKKEKKDKKKSKSSSSVETAATPTANDEQAAAEEKEKSKQIGTNSQGLFVFEYLNRRLMIRKAAIAKQKKAEQEAIFARAARVGA
ncbi:related to PXR1-essential protein involved in rRNA and snoRNA maturation [Sporisorium scitamineum]|uniref:PinX1-related protein 1 n=1 Tax=Sporisorium scitamineum TaxID=49012 RepID=A0A127Z8H1_9BASI|nr:related to PXR1-essential protein involved in rRNA and snoRNA maturation [Sporisorium scitamineum]